MSSVPYATLSDGIDIEASTRNVNSNYSIRNGIHPSSSTLKKSFSSNKTARDLKWKNINFNVGDKKILTDCWGEVKAGETCAVMGASGAGKSSLLNVLAGRSASGKNIEITGRVNVQGNDINPVTWRQNIAYVMQDDALMATATPREAFEFSAKLRLPPDTPKEQIDNIVKDLLDDLGLNDCSDVLIGGALIKGISGGQKKRVSVGIELITNPALLFLDEPTSGLDSYNAYKLVDLLKIVASSNTVVLCTIHQPSSEVFFLFDRIIFMNSGRIFYQGPVADVISHFSKHGYPCPENYNPSDFAMFINQTVPVVELEKSGVFMDIAPSDLLSDQGKIDFASNKSISTKAGLHSQLYYLVIREVTNTRRDVGALAARFGITIFLNLVYGLIFYQVGGRNNGNPSDFQSHFGGITMVAISSMFGTSQPVMLNFPFERPMFLREYSTGTYTGIAYFISKVTIELPLNFVQTVVAFALVYNLMDLQGSFINLVLANWALGCASCSVAVVLGCLVKVSY